MQFKKAGWTSIYKKYSLYAIETELKVPSPILIQMVCLSNGYEFQTQLRDKGEGSSFIP